MTDFKFNGDWKFDLKLDQLANLHSDYWFSSERNIDHKTKLNNGLVPFQIWDERTYDPDPTPQQINAINYIVNNQAEILGGLFQGFKKEINPFHAEACGDWDWIPELLNINDLGNLIGIYNIQVMTEHKDEMSYFRIDADYKGDEEHGIGIIMHKTKIIGHAGIGDLWNECIYEDLKIDIKEVYKKQETDNKIGNDMVHVPLPKYGKLKHWQENETEDYLRTILIQKRNDEFKKAIEETNWDINHRFDSLGNNTVDLAAYGNNPEMIDYLIANGGDFSKSILQCNDYYIKKEAIRCLVKHGANIDHLNSWGVTALKNEIFRYVSELNNIKAYKNPENSRYRRAIKDLAECKDRLQFYLEMGANPNSINKDGNDYKTVLKTRWNKKYLKENYVFEKIELLLNPDADIDVKEFDFGIKTPKSHKGNLNNKKEIPKPKDGWNWKIWQNWN